MAITSKSTPPQHSDGPPLPLLFILESAIRPYPSLAHSLPLPLLPGLWPAHPICLASINSEAELQYAIDIGLSNINVQSGFTLVSTITIDAKTVAIFSSTGATIDGGGQRQLFILSGGAVVTMKVTLRTAYSCESALSKIL